MNDPVEAILIGAGQRGADVYGEYARRHPRQLRFVAVAEPDPERRARFAARHRLAPDRQFPSWEPLLARPRLARAALICTQDRQHAAPALAALGAGYDVLLEKPMATTASACRQLVAAASEYSRQLQVCHVLRYAPHFQEIQRLVRSGRLGQILHVDHTENVSFWHMAHSYVRGHWGVEAKSSPLILAKCCHDFDLLLWILGRHPTHLSSFGALTHFRPENAPDGAPQHCLDGCPAAETCPYYAPFVYVDMHPFWRDVCGSGRPVARLAAAAQLRAPGLVRALAALAPPLRQVSDYRGKPRSDVHPEPNRETLLTALRESPYGRCVYRCDNDVVDHQVASMAFNRGLTATLTVHGHAHQEGRSTHIYGSRAGLSAFFGLAGGWIEVREHRSGLRRKWATGSPLPDEHGGGDTGLMEAFVASLRTGRQAPTPAREILESHLLAFAAERARREARVIAMLEQA